MTNSYWEMIGAEKKDIQRKEESGARVGLVVVGTVYFTSRGHSTAIDMSIKIRDGITANSNTEGT